MNKEINFEMIRNAATIILLHGTYPDDLIEINTFLAELEPYPSYIIQIKEVKMKNTINNVMGE